MNIVTKAESAIRALLYMMRLYTFAEEGCFVNLSMIHDSTGISVSYLEQIFSRLSAAEIIVGIRGPGGGYMLNKPAATISLYEIVMAADKNKFVTPFWIDGDVIRKNLQSRSLQDLYDHTFTKQPTLSTKHME